MLRKSDLRVATEQIRIAARLWAEVRGRAERELAQETPGSARERELCRIIGAALAVAESVEKVGRVA